MPARKIAISMDPDLYEAAKVQADEEGMSMSAWLAEAAKTRIRWAVLARAAAEDEAEYGQITEEMVERVHRPAYVSGMKQAG